MTRFFKSEAGAVVMWVIGSLVLAAVIAPWLHLWGGNLARHVAEHEAAGWLEWLGAACGRAKFSRFFNRALMLSAVFLLPLLLWRVRFLKRANPVATASRTRLPLGAGMTQFAAGLVLAGGLLWLMALGLEMAGAYQQAEEGNAPGKFITKAMVPAVVVSVVEEWLFRGLLLGLWLRLARPFTACLGTSLVFAFVHFLEPPAGVVIADPNSALAGFALLGHILGHILTPRFLLAEFVTLFAVGWILATARIRTASLWLPIGLHAGWVFAFKAFNLAHIAAQGSPLRPWWVGDSLRSGLLPLATLVLTGWLCRRMTCRFFMEQSPRIPLAGPQAVGRLAAAEDD